MSIGMPFLLTMISPDRIPPFGLNDLSFLRHTLPIHFPQNTTAIINLSLRGYVTAETLDQPFHEFLSPLKEATEFPLISIRDFDSEVGEVSCEDISQHFDLLGS